VDGLKFLYDSIVYNTIIYINLDILVLDDDWNTKMPTVSESKIKLPFDRADFRCNQISLIANSNDGNCYTNPFKLKVNFYTYRLEEFKYYGLCKYKQKEIALLENEDRNLQEIINDIVNNIAVPVYKLKDNITNKLPDAYRVIKMQKKGYSVDLKTLIPFDIYDGTNTQCNICLGEITDKLFCIKPCECNTSIHLDCWLKFMKHNYSNENNNQYFNCLHCRKEFPICFTTNYNIRSCKFINFYEQYKHHSSNTIGERYFKIKCHICEPH
jgi:hypothetical protein